jgi:putative transposase
MKDRKRNRMKGFDYSSNHLYFVTNCVKNNECCLGNVVPVGTGRDLSVHHPKNHHPENHHPEIKYKIDLNQYGLIVERKIHWLQQQYSYVVIHNYVVMPNHFHIILEINSKKVADKDVKIKSLSSLLGAMKTTSSNQIRKDGFEDFFWHRSFHDHIIRNEREYFFISNYIDMNPQKWFEDRFFSGKLKQL